MGGSAVYGGVREARAKLTAIAAHLLACAPADVLLAEGKATDRRRPAVSVGIAELATAAEQAQRLPAGVEPGLDFRTSYTLPDNPFAFAAHVAAVLVDRRTGEVRLQSYVAVHDCGPMINPKIVRGQIQGGITQGIGQALSEAMVYDESGQPLTGSLMTYGLPTAEGTPAFVLENLETPSPTNPLGIKGIGETPTVAAPVAVANAVIDALSSAGVRHVDMPLTPEKVWRALWGR